MSRVAPKELLGSFRLDPISGRKNCILVKFFKIFNVSKNLGKNGKKYEKRVFNKINFVSQSLLPN